MIMKMKKVTETFDMRAFTDGGDYFGDVDECLIASNKIAGWRIKSAKGSVLSKSLGNAKGVIVPHQLVKAMGDIMIVNRNAVPSYSEEEEN